MKSIQGGGGNGENIEVPKKVDKYYNLNLTLIEVTGQACRVVMTVI